MVRQVVMLGAALLLNCSATAAPPSWWTDDQQGTRIISSDSSALPNNYGPIALGQLKFVAKQAKKHLDLELSAVGGTGPQITALVGSFLNDPATNYSPVNLGQLKAVAKPFYDRLIALGYDTKLNLKNHGAPAWSFVYPWNPATPVAENYAPANIGQVKWVFSFSLTAFDTSQSDADGDGLPDSWEVAQGISPFDVIGANGSLGDMDGDGVPNREDARPNNASIGRMHVTITTPAHGAVVP